jgi:5-methylcytosine-specific restriction endonuclease McrA
VLAENRKRLAFTLWFRQRGFCAYCEKPLAPLKFGNPNQPEPDDPTLDHVWPRIKGGPDRPENIVLACFHCNQEKGKTDPFLFLKYSALTHVLRAGAASIP